MKNENSWVKLAWRFLALNIQSNKRSDTEYFKFLDSKMQVIVFIEIFLRSQ